MRNFYERKGSESLNNTKKKFNSKAYRKGNEKKNKTERKKSNIKLHGVSSIVFTSLIFYVSWSKHCILDFSNCGKLIRR